MPDSFLLSSFNGTFQMDDMMAQNQEITPQSFSQNMGQLKRRIAQVQGETQQMSADTMSQSMEQIMQMVNSVFQQKAQTDRLLQETQGKLDKVYQSHPELKISEEAAAKEEAAKKTGRAKKV